MFFWMYIFEYCLLSNNCKILPAKCFSGCSQLKQIEIPSCVTKICANAFNGAGLINVTFVDPVGWHVDPYLDASNIAQDGTLAGWGRTQIRYLKTETFTIDRTYSLDHYNTTLKMKLI